MARRNIKLTISYDGGGYHGWQKQLEHIITVQQLLEGAVLQAVGHPVKIRGSGRTDAGVHAKGQVANFFADTPIPSERLHRVICRYLPDDIRVRRAEDVADDFDAIGSSRGKLYRYTVFNHNEIPIMLKPYCYKYYPSCDLDAMQRAAAHLIGRHDFASFTSSGCKRQSTVRTLFCCRIWQKYHCFFFDLEGDGFLYHMVRNIVGTLLAIGRGHWPAEHITNILNARDRNAAGPLAPANGLCLQWVKY